MSASKEKAQDILFSVYENGCCLHFKSLFLLSSLPRSLPFFARRSLSYLMDEMPQEALNDAMQIQEISHVWHIASYLQAATLSSLGMETEAQSALKKGTVLEAKRNTAAGHKCKSRLRCSDIKSDTTQICDNTDGLSNFVLSCFALVLEEIWRLCGFSWARCVD